MKENQKQQAKSAGRKRMPTQSSPQAAGSRMDQETRYLDTQTTKKAIIIPPSKRAGGRPSSFNQAVADELCQRVAVREPLHKVCADPRMPCEVTVYKWRQQFPEFAKKYARAREARAESRADRIDQYIDDVKAGTLDPNQARVMIDAEKWQSSKEQPKRFGDRVELDTPADGGIAKALAVSQVAIAALIAKGRQQ